MSATQNVTIHKFDGTERHDWPEFEKKMLAIGIVKGGWDDASEQVLDMTDADNVKLKQAGMGLPHHHDGRRSSE